jgi:hypothetical protein
MRFVMVATWCVVVCLAGLGLADVLAGCGAGGIGPESDRYYESDAAPASGAIIASDDPKPSPTPEPTPPKLLTFEQVMGYQKRWEQKQEEYLSQHGWRQGSDTPGKLVFWQKAYKDINYRLASGQAIYVQRGISEEEAQAALERQIEQSTGVQ